MNVSELMLGELQQEAATTRRMLERVPQDAIGWKPHDKSMTLGQLSAHVANLLGKWFNATLNEDEFDIAAEFPPLRTDSISVILEAFDRNISEAVELLKGQSDERLFTTWRLRRGEQLIFEMPRYAVLRAMVFNHLIHHRGQLSVYLRLRNVPLPFVYGPTADENPAA